MGLSGSSGTTFSWGVASVVDSAEVECEEVMSAEACLAAGNWIWDEGLRFRV